MKRLAWDADIRSDQPDVFAKFHYLLCKQDEPHEAIKFEKMYRIYF